MLHVTGLSGYGNVQYIIKSSPVRCWIFCCCDCFCHCACSSVWSS